MNYLDQEKPGEPQPFKSWLVKDRWDEMGEIVHADSRGKAINKSAIYHDSGYEFTEFKARRAKEFDGITPTDKLYLENGYWPVECTGCHKELDMEHVEDGLAFFDAKEQVWCKNCMAVKQFGE